MGQAQGQEGGTAVNFDKKKHAEKTPRFSKNSPGIDKAIHNAEDRAGRISVTGRYHQLPRKLEDDYVLAEKVLGSGLNGDVRLAKGRRRTEENFAVKAFGTVGIAQDVKEDLEAEAEIFLSMDHPHVARLVDVYETPESISLVMECCDGGELYDRVAKRRRFSERDASHAVLQMLYAVNYLHGHGIVHRDLKLENFLYETEGSDHLKLIDFGFSRVWDPATRMAASCGTLAYVAPEVLGKNYTSQCDLWSLGVIIYILVCGSMPFSGDQQAQMASIKRAAFSVRGRFRNISATAQDLIQRLLVLDPSVRLTATGAMEHEWFKIHGRESATVPDVETEVVSALLDFAKASRFRRACLFVMAWSLTNDERAGVREAFLEIDRDRSGAISLGELKTVLVNHLDVGDDKTKAVFDALDTSHHEEIHYSEFLAAMCSSRITLHDQLLQATFRRFDRDDSGFISVDNLKEVLGDSFEGIEVQAMMDEADPNHAGRISYEEFMAYLRGDDALEVHKTASIAIIDRQLREQPFTKTLSLAADGPPAKAHLRRLSSFLRVTS